MHINIEKCTCACACACAWTCACARSRVERGRGSVSGVRRGRGRGLAFVEAGVGSVATQAMERGDLALRERGVGIKCDAA